jgi:hypothetical protein
MLDYWMKQFPNQSLPMRNGSWCKYEPIGWEWNIAPNSSINKLASGGGMVPDKSWWGKNIVGVEWKRSQSFLFCQR